MERDLLFLIKPFKIYYNIYIITMYSQNPTKRQPDKVPTKEQFRRFYKGSRRKCINGINYIKEKSKKEEEEPEPVKVEQKQQTQTQPGTIEAFDTIFAAVEFLETNQNKLNNNLVQKHRDLKIKYETLESEHNNLKDNYKNLEERLESLESKFNDPYYGLF